MFVVHHSRLRRIFTGKQRRARRITKRKLRESSIEPDSARREFVEIRRLYDLVTVTAECCAQIIRCDQDDVVLCLLRGSARAGATQKHQCNQAEANSYDYAIHSD